MKLQYSSWYKNKSADAKYTKHRKLYWILGCRGILIFTPQQRSSKNQEVRYIQERGLKPGGGLTGTFVSALEFSRSVVETILFLPLTVLRSLAVDFSVNCPARRFETPEESAHSTRSRDEGELFSLVLLDCLYPVCSLSRLLSFVLVIESNGEGAFPSDSALGSLLFARLSLSFLDLIDSRDEEEVFSLVLLGCLYPVCFLSRLESFVLVFKADGEGALPPDSVLGSLLFADLQAESSSGFLDSTRSPGEGELFSLFFLGWLHPVCSLSRWVSATLVVKGIGEIALPPGSVLGLLFVRLEIELSVRLGEALVSVNLPSELIGKCALSLDSLADSLSSVGLTAASSLGFFDLIGSRIDIRLELTLVSVVLVFEITGERALPPGLVFGTILFIGLEVESV